MKVNLSICLVVFVISLGSFASAQTNNRVVITGVVEQSCWEKNYVDIGINRFGLRQVQKKFKIDEKGHFKCEFNVSTATDVWFEYRTNFLIAVHPGDSINVVLDGSKDDRSLLLKSIKFSGTAAGKLNQDIAVLQQLYFNSPLYTVIDKQRRKNEVEIIKNSSSDEYRKYLSTQKEEILNSFIKMSNPCQEARLWGELFLAENALDKIARYPRMHQEYNKLENVKIPLDYYDVYLDLLPLTDSMLISGYAISGYVNLFHFYYVRTHVGNEENRFHCKLAEAEIEKEKQEQEARTFFDSIDVSGIIKYTPDTLLRQMVLTEFFKQKFDKANISAYEKHIDIVQRYISLPYLSIPLTDYYEKTKKTVMNPKLASDQILMKSANSSIAGIIDTILINHKNKVIYIDCWATWCGPCIAEFPNSKILNDEMQGKDVSFIYFCIDSKEKEGRALIDRHQLKGEHYYLTQAQSDDLRRIFEVNGIPHYIMFDKTGTVLGKDYNLRPSSAKSEIEMLLKK